MLRELEGRSHEEIAETLGVTSGAARQHLMRARVALRGAVTAITPYPLVVRLAEMLASPGAAGWTDAAVGAGAGATLAKLTAGVAATGALVGGAVGTERVVHHRHSGQDAAERSSGGVGGEAAPGQDSRGEPPGGRDRRRHRSVDERLRPRISERLRDRRSQGARIATTTTAATTIDRAAAAPATRAATATTTAPATAAASHGRQRPLRRRPAAVATDRVAATTATAVADAGAADPRTAAAASTSASDAGRS